ncbi:MAG: cyclic pyranopterin monophosphate synthase MoaC [Nitrospirae bacterium]|nr:MAG: cyclic pyranopterin monophosphate synthase MoaC [Nitrospirota bacterium]
MKFSHTDGQGKAKMVDVSDKAVTEREAVASATVLMKPATLKLIKENKIQKGDVLAVAKIAGIMAAKKTAGLVPMCHPLNISHVALDFGLDERKSAVGIISRVKIKDRTGVEMEALTAASVAALTIYDMCKAADKDMVISDIMLLEKRGGKSGEFKRKKKR